MAMHNPIGRTLLMTTLHLKVLEDFVILFNVNTFLKLISTSKSWVTYDTDTTTHKIIGVVGSPLYLATPVSTALPKSQLSL